MALAWSTLYSGTLEGRAVGYANGYYMAQSGVGGTAVRFAAATDPRGTWTAGSAVTIPDSQLSYYPAGNAGERFLYDGTNYLLAMPIYTGAPGARLCVLSATDPTSTWTAYVPTSVGLWPSAFYKFGSTWIAAGDKADYSASLTFTASDPLGTWTQVLSESINTSIVGYQADGATLYRLVRDSTSTAKVQSATDPAGAWTTEFTGDTSFIPIYQAHRPGIIKHDNGYWTICTRRYSDFTCRVYYTTDPTTWTDYFDLSPGTDWNISSLRYGNGLWTMALSNDVSSVDGRITYYESTGSPNGTYTTASEPYGDEGAFDCYSNADGEHLFIGDLSSTKVAGITGGPYSPYVAPTYLRQRQSPVRAPSRVRPVQLRQRQRPEIT